MKLNDVQTSVLYNIVIPSTNKKAKFRPLNVKEERALLTAHESEDTATMVNTLNQVVKNCLIPSPDKFTNFDLEYIFTQIRSKSVGETATLIFSCDGEECADVKLPITISLDKVKLVHHPEHKDTIKITDDIVIKLKYPSVEELIEVEMIDDPEESQMKAICAAVDSVFVKDEIIKAEEETPEAIFSFINNLTREQYKPLSKFFETIPYVAVDVAYRCPKCQKQHSREIKGLENFFS